MAFAVWLAAAFCCFPQTVSSAVSFDFEVPVFYVPGEIVKDHALIEVDGIFHLYYMATDGRSFEYATSPDLRHWTIEGEVLRAGPDAWDGYEIWAPTVVYYPSSPGYFLMYYTGVNGSMAQRTCLAFSHITDAFYKAGGALFTPFHGDTIWMRWTENEWSNYRDPGFFRENGVCYLVQAAQTRDLLGAIALARSNDYFHWEDAGPLYIHNNWHALESPFLMKRNGVYHLFFTEEGVGGVSHMFSDSLRSGWDITKRSVIDAGHAAEVLDLGSDRYIISRHTSYVGSAETVSSIRFDTLGWNGVQPEVRMPGPHEGWKTLWGTAFDHQPVFGDNPRFRGDTTHVGFEGNSWIGTYEAFAGPLTGTTPGAIQGDAPRGAIQSGTFVITGYSMRLLVGGGYYPDSCYVALYEASTGRMLLRETGNGSDRMTERIWNLYPFRGESVYLRIVDNCSAPFGHINVDGIEERSTVVGPPPNDGGTTVVRNKRRALQSEASREREDASSPAGGATAGSGKKPALSGRPNPFNPATTLEIHAAPRAELTVSLYDVAGRRVRGSRVVTDSDGDASLRWDGRDDRGRSLSSGVYLAVLESEGRLVASCKLVLAR